jgi:hypothetical protein
VSALETFDRELSEHIVNGKDYWYDEGIVTVSRLAAALSEEDLVTLGDLWSLRPLAWQKHCAEVLDQARHTQTVALLLDFIDRAVPDVALAALESLSEFDPALLTEAQRQRLIRAIETVQAHPTGPLHQRILDAFLARLRGDEPETK